MYISNQVSENQASFQPHLPSRGAWGFLFGTKGQTNYWGGRICVD